MYLFSAPGIMTIVVIALLLFGPEKLPEMARTFGRFMAEFKRAQEAVETTIRAEMHTGEKTVAAATAAASAAAPGFSQGGSDEDDEEEDEE